MAKVIQGFNEIVFSVPVGNLAGIFFLLFIGFTVCGAFALVMTKYGP